MDDTETSLNKPPDCAAATRKRRSSILKNHRPPRTPFSEVELFVATPTDTAKNRRVSFSRRTGVAEFVTNEATTTWKNFYEEHNKSLESSGNESAGNAPRQTIAHIGKRIFDQQFEEVEAVDFGGTLQANSLQQFQTSFNNMNFTQQIASMESVTEERKLVSQINFELSGLTEHSKPFSNEMSVPVLEDMTNQVNMDFSVVLPVAASTKCDDLDEIQKDLERSKSNVMCPGPMGADRDFSEYIEVDLNMTHVAVHQDESEISITDTVKSPKLVDLSKSFQINKEIKSSIKDVDWSNDKENIAINPYIAPKQSLNFAINEASDQVLVFDGKRLTTQPIISRNSEMENRNMTLQTLRPNAPKQIPQRKTITLNVNDDLPNFIKNNTSANLMELHSFEENLKSTSATTTNIIGRQIQKTESNIHTLDNDYNSEFVTNSHLATKEIYSDEKHKEVYEDDIDISLTRALPSNIISTNLKPNTSTNSKEILLNKEPNKTIVYENFASDISITQAVPNFIIDQQRKKEVLQSELMCHDMNDTKAATQNVQEKRKTILFDSYSGDISMTQALPTNINFTQKENKLINKQSHYVDSNNEAEKNNELVNIERRRTIIFDSNSCDISMTQALPTNINFTQKENKLINKQSHYIDSKNEDEKNNELVNIERRRTIIFDSNSCDISMTQALPINIKYANKECGLVDGNLWEIGTKFQPHKEISNTEKRKTIIFDSDSCDISITQTLPTNINIIKKENNLVLEEKCQLVDKTATEIYCKNTDELSNTGRGKTLIFDSDSCDISMTQVLPTNINVNHSNCKVMEKCLENSNTINSKLIQRGEATEEKQKTVLLSNESCDISMTQVISSNINIHAEDKQLINNNLSQLNSEMLPISENHKTLIFEDEQCDLSVTQSMSTNIHFDKDNILPSQLIESTTNKLQENDCDLKQTITGIELPNIIDPKVNSSHVKDDNTGDIDVPVTSISDNLLLNKTNNIGDTINNTKSCDISLEQNMGVIFNMNKDNASAGELITSNNFLSTLKHSEVNLSDTLRQGAQESCNQSQSNNIECNIEKRKTITFNTDNDTNYSNENNTMDNGCVENKTNILNKTNIEHDRTSNNTINITLDAKNISMVIPTTIMNIQKDVMHELETKNTSLSKLKINEHSDLHTSDVKTNESVYIYQVERNDPHDSKHDVNESITEKSVEEMSSDDLISNVTPVKFSCDDDEEHNEEITNNIMKEVKHASHPSDVCMATSKPKKSILDELLNMSCESIDDNTNTGVVNKFNNITIKSDNNTRVIVTDTHKTESKESYLIIRSDSDTPIGSNNISTNCLNIKDYSKIDESGSQSDNQKLGQISFLKETGCNDPKLEQTLQNQLAELKETTKYEGKENDKFNSELNTSRNKINDSFSDEHVQKFRSFRYADNTKELLEMLSDFTNDGHDEDSSEEKNNSDERITNENEDAIVENKECVELTGKSFKQESKRLSIAPRRQTITISREDLLNNISMAQAALLKSRFESEDSESMDDTAEIIETPEDQNELQTSQRMSKEVVKTLQFEDESGSDTSINSGVKISPLKKNAIGETSFRNECKAKVIPQYIDVSESIKELMHDLVKPTSDLPYVGVSTKKDTPSTNSTEVQANLMTSSQIDIDVELQSNYVSAGNVDVKGDKSIVSDMALTDSSGPTNISLIQNTYCTKGLDTKPPIRNLVSSQPTAHDRVIIFDHHNPLNNIVLPVIDNTKAHKYNPVEETEKESCVIEEYENIVDSTNYELRQSIQYNVENITTEHRDLQSGDTASNKYSKEQSDSLDVKKTFSIDKSTEGTPTDIKHKEANTSIVMKGNKELLEISSSLTLVDDALTDSELDSDAKSDRNLVCMTCEGSPVRIIFKKDNEFELEKDSDVTSIEETECVDVGIKPRKRSYSPTKNTCLANVDGTPTPISKIQKMSNSPIVINTKISNETEDIKNNERKDLLTSVTLKKIQDRPEEQNRLGTIDAEYIPKENMKKSNISQSSSMVIDLETLPSNVATSVGIPSITSDSEMQDQTSTISQVISSVNSQISILDWQPKYVNEQPTELNNLRKHTECELSANVVAKINMLSFMGSHECEWEHSGSPDTWSFRLLRGRLRLRVRLAHRHHSSLRAFVRADTPLQEVEIDVVQNDGKDNLIDVCVHLAAEAMRYERSRVCGEVGGAEGGVCAVVVPSLLRRCAAVARLALRWARVMRAARFRLAYDITPGGLISLKVANFTLHSVWELRMRLSLVVGDARSGACPRADDVHVVDVLATHTPDPAVLQRLVAAQPMDWGHAPRTLLKVFRYLKNRTSEDDLLASVG